MGHAQSDLSSLDI